MTISPAVAAADRSARRLTRRHYENFWVSSIVVPRGLRRHLARIYSYCRITDDLGDERQGGAAAELIWWREDVLRCFTDPPAARDPALAALTQTIATFRLPSQPFLDLIEANLRDQRVHHYQSYEELMDYCRLSAAPVGRLVLRLFGIVDPQLEAWSDDVCIGLQLANFAQDVSIDRRKGRTYLIESEVRSGGVAGAIRSTCEQAATLLRSGRQLEGRVPYRLAIQLSLYRLGGEAILAAIKRNGYRTDRSRPQVSTPVKAGLLFLALGQSFTRSSGAHRYRAA